MTEKIIIEEVKYYSIFPTNSSLELTCKLILLIKDSNNNVIMSIAYELVVLTDLFKAFCNINNIDKKIENEVIEYVNVRCKKNKL